MDSILTSIKKLLGIDASYKHFDTDIIMHINSVFFILYQMGVGPETCFRIEDDMSDWDEFIIDDERTDLESVKTYIYLKVKLLFDPPSSSAVLEAMNRMINEFEWRLNFEAECKTTEE